MINHEFLLCACACTHTQIPLLRLPFLARQQNEKYYWELSYYFCSDKNQTEHLSIHVMQTLLLGSLPASLFVTVTASLHSAGGMGKILLSTDKKHSVWSLAGISQSENVLWNQKHQGGTLTFCLYPNKHCGPDFKPIKYTTNNRVYDLRRFSEVNSASVYLKQFVLSMSTSDAVSRTHTYSTVLMLWKNLWINGE